jgi:hypothetical protein
MLKIKTQGNFAIEKLLLMELRKTIKYTNKGLKLFYTLSPGATSKYICSSSAHI